MRKMMLVQLIAVFVVGLSALTVAAQEVSERTIKGGVLNGKAISLPKPAYPAEAKAAGLEGTVYVDVVIDESGNVISAVASTEPRKVRRPGQDPEEVEVPVADPLLREAAEKAASEARFSPTLLSGVPVKVSGTVVYNFVAKASAAMPSVINGGILNGKTTSMPMPAYPEAARAVNATGSVAVKITVDENGDVISAEAVSGHPLLRAAAVEAARLAKLAPTRLNGQPIKVSGILTYNFIGPKNDSN